MTPKEKLIQSITRMLPGLDETKLRMAYQFLLHL